MTSYTLYVFNEANGPKLQNNLHVFFYYIGLHAKKILMMSYISAHHYTKILYIETNLYLTPP